MTNQAKQLSEKNGNEYLRRILLDVGDAMCGELQRESRSQTHDGTLGEGCENIWRQLLRKYLPARYQVEDAFVIDSCGHTSDQIDIVIFDATFTSPLYGHSNKKYLPRESVYAIFEAKPTVNKKYLNYAGCKARSVNNLHCTSAPIVNAGQSFPAREIFRPLTGLIAYNAEWSGGLSSSSFNENLPSDEECCLDFVLTAKSGFYDGREKSDSSLHEGEGAMMKGIFRLLQALQELGTVPAIDWAIYERVMEEKQS